jgi:hypothetical protein
MGDYMPVESHSMFGSTSAPGRGAIAVHFAC